MWKNTTLRAQKAHLIDGLADLDVPTRLWSNIKRHHAVHEQGVAVYEAAAWARWAWWVKVDQESRVWRYVNVVVMVVSPMKLPQSCRTRDTCATLDVDSFRSALTAARTIWEMSGSV